MPTPTTRCERCGHASATAHRPFNEGICATCWSDIESLEEHALGPVLTIAQMDRLAAAGLLDDDE